MTSPSRAARSLELQSDDERLGHAQELQHQHRAVLVSFPETQILLPVPQDNSTSSPQHSELQDLVGQLYTSDFRCDDEYLVYTFPENRSIDQDPSTWLDDFVASLCSIVVVARMMYRIQNLDGPERHANTQRARHRHRQTALCRLFVNGTKCRCCCVLQWM